MPEPQPAANPTWSRDELRLALGASSGATVLWGRNLRGGSYAHQPRFEITYCRLCGWGLRAGWMAQELLTTFAEELGSVTLTPDGTGGVFEVRVNDEVIWSRKEQGRFPELKEIKQLIRDRVAPGRSLGHTDAP
jgi:selenoprotein W-related protein